MAMTGHWEDLEEMKARVRPEGGLAHALWVLGVTFVILGVASDAFNQSVGLESGTWLLLAIAMFLASIVSEIEWAVAWYLRTTHEK